MIGDEVYAEGGGRVRGGEGGDSGSEVGLELRCAVGFDGCGVAG